MTTATMPTADPTYEPDRADGLDGFTREEIRQFEADDVEAGRNIGKILASLFVYTLIAMSIVTWWTFKVVQP